MSELGDFRSEFDAIIEGMREEQRDPIVTQLLENVMEAEVALSYAGESANERQGEVLMELNSESEAAELSGHMVIVSGRVRPSEFVGVGEDEDNADLLKQEFGDLGELQHDTKGPYYLVTQRIVACGDFEIVDVPAEGTTTEKKIILYLNANVDTDPTDGWLYTYPEELDVLVPQEPSYLKINQDITRRYEGIARQIEALPVNCEDDQQIIAALKELRLELNWHDYPRHLDDEKTALIDHIEQYITNRVIFDNSLYALTVHGLVLGVNSRDQRFVQPFEGSKVINGYVGHVRLLREMEDEEDGDIDEDVAHYRLMLEVFAPAAGRQNGDHMIYVPLSAIDGIQNTRNEDFFAQEMSVFAHPFEDSGLVTYDTEADNESDDDEDAPEYTVEVDVGKDTSEREQVLAALNERIGELFTQVDEITSKLYNTEEDALAARLKIDAYIEAFNDLYPKDVATIIEAEGPGVRSMDAVLDSEGSSQSPDDDNSIYLKFNNIAIQESDIFTTKRGVYAFHALTGIGIADADTDRYGVEALLVFADIERPTPITFGSPEVSLPLYTLTPSKRFVVRIDGSDTRLTIPEYERLRKCSEAIRKVSEKVPDLSFLPWQLSELQEAIDGADPTDFNDLEDISLVQAIGESVGGDEEASQLTVDALMEILGEHPIEVVGPMYASDGTPVESQEIQGLVENVISTLTTIPTEEPMLMMTTLEGTWYVPLSTLERFRY